jgi:hypothetical protein
MSAISRNIGKEFEERIEPTFAAYAKANVAYLSFMPVPTRAVMMQGRMVRVGNGAAPFDVYGFMPRSFGGTPAYKPSNEYEPDAHFTPSTLVAVMVGAELKASGEPETSIPIVKPKGDGHGVEAHQLDALALLSRMGGIARIVWDNGGEIGVLRNEGILAAHAIFMASLASEDRGKGKGKVGSRSIRWERFEKVDPAANIGGTVTIDWLLADAEYQPRKAA